MNSDNKISIFNSISFRVPLMVIAIIVIGIGMTVVYYLRSQNSTIIESKEMEIRQEANILYTSIKNNMLAGEAPIAVDLFRDLSRLDFVSDIMLYRKNGVRAFSDNSTLLTVNKNLGDDFFAPKEIFLPMETVDDADFARSVKDVLDVFVRNIGGVDKRLIVYKPLINQPRCSRCHGLDHVVRGVIKISSPVNEVYREARKNIFISMAIYSGVVLVLTSVIIIFLRRIIILRIFKLGTVVEAVGDGDFKTRVSAGYPDEIGILATRINTMIDGLNERFKLTKFVSKSTLDHVRGDDEIQLGGEKKFLTVLFSDIRGFTSYSEKRDPEEVMAMLNEVMNMQAQIIQEFGGDVDKYVGDELMAVFEGDDMVYRALRASEKIRNEIDAKYRNQESPIFVGIGINTGEMIAGNMGSTDRIDRTVIGDAVNLGARLVSIAGKNTIVISQFCYDEVSDRIEVNEHDAIKVKGKEKPVKIYTLRRTK